MWVCIVVGVVKWDVHPSMEGRGTASLNWFNEYVESPGNVVFGVSTTEQHKQINENNFNQALGQTHQPWQSTTYYPGRAKVGPAIY
jgi:hypothetical protein